MFSEMRVRALSGRAAAAASVGRLLCLAMCCCAAVLSNSALADELGCGPRKLGDFGPYDYRSADARRERPRVEKFHFGPQVEYLNPALSEKRIASDVDFVLRYFPNHHRALITLTKLARKTKSTQPPGLRFNVACWFARAKAIAPDDGMVSIIYGNYLLKRKRTKEALAEFKRAEEVGGENMNLYYNMGLGYFRLGRYHEARSAAKKAYAMGHPLPGLRNLLKRKKQWEE